jgi:hypothetical protein
LTDAELSNDKSVELGDHPDQLRDRARAHRPANLGSRPSTNAGDPFARIARRPAAQHRLALGF